MHPLWETLWGHTATTPTFRAGPESPKHQGEGCYLSTALLVFEKGNGSGDMPMVNQWISGTAGRAAQNISLPLPLMTRAGGRDPSQVPPWRPGWGGRSSGRGFLEDGKFCSRRALLCRSGQSSGSPSKRCISLIIKRSATAITYVPGVSRMLLPGPLGNKVSLMLYSWQLNLRSPLAKTSSTQKHAAPSPALASSPGSTAGRCYLMQGSYGKPKLGRGVNSSITAWKLLPGSCESLAHPSLGPVHEASSPEKAMVHAHPWCFPSSPVDGVSTTSTGTHARMHACTCIALSLHPTQPQAFFTQG